MARSNSELDPYKAAISKPFLCRNDEPSMIYLLSLNTLLTDTLSSQTITFHSAGDLQSTISAIPTPCETHQPITYYIRRYGPVRLTLGTRPQAARHWWTTRTRARHRNRTMCAFGGMEDMLLPSGLVDSFQSVSLTHIEIVLFQLHTDTPLQEEPDCGDTHDRSATQRSRIHDH